MSTGLRLAIEVILAAASLVLVAEFLLTAAGGLFAMAQGRERFEHLTGLRPGPVAQRLMGLVALLAAAGVALGYLWPAAAVAAACYLALLTGFTLVRQLQRGQRGGELFAYGLFLLCSLIVIAARLALAR
jgi:hypothetical protein